MAEMMVVNPRRRKRRSAKRKSPARKRVVHRVSHRVSNPRMKKRRRIRRHRNPTNNFFRDDLIPAFAGAAGAIGFDYLFNKLPIPDRFKTPETTDIAKVATIAGIGLLFAKQRRQSRIINHAVKGALTVAMYGLGNATLNRVRYGTPAITNETQGMSEYFIRDKSAAGLGEFMTNKKLGYASPSRIFQNQRRNQSAPGQTLTENWY